jgi:hypothetical protein
MGHESPLSLLPRPAIQLAQRISYLPHCPHILERIGDLFGRVVGKVERFEVIRQRVQVFTRHLLHVSSGICGA